MNYNLFKIVHVSENLFDFANPLMVTFYIYGLKGIFFPRHNELYYWSQRRNLEQLDEIWEYDTFMIYLITWTVLSTKISCTDRIVDRINVKQNFICQAPNDCKVNLKTFYFLCWHLFIIINFFPLYNVDFFIAFHKPQAKSICI